MGASGLYLGTETAGGGRLELGVDHLTTHAVCLGMTGSGKTGLGIVALEELARRGVPLLVFDLKGDMVDLMLTFPDLDAADFEPWLPPDAVAGASRAEAAARLASTWRQGLEGSGLGAADVRAVRDGVAWRLLTPGAGAVAPLDILPALSAPEGWDPGADPDAAAQRVDGVTSGLLSLVGRGGDPLTDRDHVLMASVILEHWRRHVPLDLPRLLAALADPPMATLGALPLDAFYPRSERMGLVLALNTLLASPAFAAWTRGVPLVMEELLGRPGAPRATIVTVAHLDERQRLFVLALIVSELVAWMRRQPASEGLRALLYLDEVQGILPPHPANPATKGPLLTLLKQGRAFGVGAWLATQNPVDLDYKALGNAGVKLIGRLVTDRDRERALEGLGMTTLPDGRDARQLVAGLGKREFLLDDVRATPRVRTFSSRWAMSYLRGPVALSELGPLVGSGGVHGPVASPRMGSTRPGPTQSAESDRPPVLAVAATTRFMAGGSGLASPWLEVASRVTVERASLSLYRRLEERWRVPVAADGAIDWNAASTWPDELELVDEPPAALRFPAAAPSRLAKELEGAARAFSRWRGAQPALILAHPKLKLVAEPDEPRQAFIERCRQAADRADDVQQEKVRSRFASRIDTLRRRLDRERGELERDQSTLAARKAEEKLGIVEGLFSVLLGSRSVRTAAGKAASRARTVATKRRMRQTAEGSVEESAREIERLELELESLAEEMQFEVDRIAAESDALAEQVEDIAVRPRAADLELVSLTLVWG